MFTTFTDSESPAWAAVRVKFLGLDFPDHSGELEFSGRVEPRRTPGWSNAGKDRGSSIVGIAKTGKPGGT